MVVKNSDQIGVLKRGQKRGKWVKDIIKDKRPLIVGDYPLSKGLGAQISKSDHVIIDVDAFSSSHSLYER